MRKWFKEAQNGMIHCGLYFLLAGEWRGGEVKTMQSRCRQS